MLKAESVIRAGGDGERRSFCGGGLMTFKATSEDTAGAFLLFEDQMIGGKVTPLHVHVQEDETFYVLEGEILVHIDGIEHRVGARGMAMVPRGIPHAFKVVSAAARILTLLVPGTAEAFYRAASDPATADSPIDGAVDFARVRAAAEATGGMKLVGPPPFGPA
jgi:quercetin dioxygenase-like cupin family protein